MGPTFLVIGLALLGGAIFHYYRTKSWINSSQTALGKIHKLVASEFTDSEGDTTVSHYPIVRFYINGHQYEFKNGMAVNPRKFREGESYTVWYNPRNPNDARLDANRSMLLWPSVLGILGGFLVWAGLYAWEG